MAKEIKNLQAKIARYGGRQKGTPNRDKFDLWTICQKYKLTPFEFHMKVLNKDWEGLGFASSVYHFETPEGAVKEGEVITLKDRIASATAACRYLYPQLNAVEMSGDINVNHEEQEKTLNTLKDIHSKGQLLIGDFAPKTKA
jgi:hypothetical protein